MTVMAEFRPRDAASAQASSSRGGSCRSPLPLSDDEPEWGIGEGYDGAALVSPAVGLARRKTPTMMTSGGSPRTAPGGTVRSGLRRRSKSCADSPAVRRRVVSICDSALAPPPRSPASAPSPNKLLALARAASFVKKPTRGAAAFESDSDEDVGIAEFRSRASHQFQNCSLFGDGADDDDDRGDSAKENNPKSVAPRRPATPMPALPSPAPLAPGPKRTTAEIEESFRQRLANAASNPNATPWGRPPPPASEADASALRSFARKAKRIDFDPPDSPSLKRRQVTPRAGDAGDADDGGRHERRSSNGSNGSSTTDEELDPHASLLNILFGGMRAAD